MAQLKSLIVTGDVRIIGKTYGEFIGSLDGNAATATKLFTARTISLTGSVTGSGSFDGSDNLSIETTTNHSHAASNINAGTFAATGVKAATGTDYTTARIRNIQASTTDLTAGSSSLASGDIYIVYE